jgi:hypothetical protein
MKKGTFRDVTPCGSLRIDISEEHIGSIIRVARIGKPGTALAVTSKTEA